LGRGVRGTIRHLLAGALGIDRIAALQAEQRNILAYTAWLTLLQSTKYRDERSLARHGFKVYSQAEEDGLLHEIFRRIGTENRNFIEIGVSHGRECNTRLLLAYGWRGAWIDASAEYEREIKQVFVEEIASDRLRVLCDLVTRENVNALISSLGEMGSLDLLSIDVDRNDYHILKALAVVSPRVIVAEYNPVYAPPVEWVIDYDPNRYWQGGDRYGASLKSYELMLGEKGYALVGCTLNGNNAFFVRRDLLADRFISDTSAERHYEPQRFWLTHAFVGGHGADLAT
jgi:hypothetical protein